MSDTLIGVPAHELVTVVRQPRVQNRIVLQRQRSLPRISRVDTNYGTCDVCSDAARVRYEYTCLRQILLCERCQRISNNVEPLNSIPDLDRTIAGITAHRKTLPALRAFAMRALEQLVFSNRIDQCSAGRDICDICRCSPAFTYNVGDMRMYICVRCCNTTLVNVKRRKQVICIGTYAIANMPLVDVCACIYKLFAVLMII